MLRFLSSKIPITPELVLVLAAVSVVLAGFVAYFGAPLL